MNKFFTSKEVYEERISICKACVYYFKPSGQCKRCLCFMKVKARISTQECPQKYWLKTNKVEILDDIPEEIIEEIKKLMPDLKRGKAKNQTAKKKMIELYNTIHNTKYSVGTNCGSCITTCFDGIKNIYDKHSE